MKKILVLILSSIGLLGFSQVGVNTNEPDKSSVLDIQNKSGENKGMLIPRKTNAEISAITTPANGLLVYSLDKKCISQNTGTPEQPSWKCITGNNGWFYMPSIVIDIATLGEKTINLYDLYREQFEKPVSANPSASSVGGEARALPFFENREDLIYYIMDYDKSKVSNIKIDGNGNLSYTVIAVPEDEKEGNCTFMNIALALKK